MVINRSLGNVGASSDTLQALCRTAGSGQFEESRLEISCEALRGPRARSSRRRILLRHSVILSVHTVAIVTLRCYRFYSNVMWLW